jgi:drug/metabolite transporter (DMT)-like permease
MFFMMIFLTLAFQFEKAGRVAPIQYSQLLIVAALDVLVLGTRLQWNQILGALLIAVSNLSVSILKCLNCIQ